jgi:hypothetical protein
VQVFRYMLIGRTMWISFFISSTTVGGVVSPQLTIKVPGGYRARTPAYATFWASDNGTETVALAEAAVLRDTIVLHARPDLTVNWTASAGATNVAGQICIDVLEPTVG